MALATFPKLRRLLANLSLAFPVLASTGCGGAEGKATGSTCPSESTLTYANFGQAFVQTNCGACHGARGPESPKLDSVALIRANSASIDQNAAAGPDAVNTVMPEGGSVSEAERRKLGEWLACGAPD
jgi:mono/diheme cytochrome c family protein